MLDKVLEVGQECGHEEVANEGETSIKGYQLEDVALGPVTDQLLLTLVQLCPHVLVKVDVLSLVYVCSIDVPIVRKSGQRAFVKRQIETWLVCYVLGFSLQGLEQLIAVLNSHNGTLLYEMVQAIGFWSLVRIELGAHGVSDRGHINISRNHTLTF